MNNKEICLSTAALVKVQVNRAALLLDNGAMAAFVFGQFFCYVSSCSNKRRDLLFLKKNLNLFSNAKESEYDNCAQLV